MIYHAEAKFKYIKRPTHKGMGTAYSGSYEIDKTGKNACQFNAKKLPKKWQVYYAAMNEADWKKMGGKRGVCGRCLEVVGVKGETTRGHKIKPVIVKVVDLCPDWACKRGNVDFSKVALKKITGYSWDKKKIQWRYTDCEASTPKPSKPSKPSNPSPPESSGYKGFESEDAYDIYSALE